MATTSLAVGSHVALARDLRRRGMVMEATSTWRTVRFCGSAVASNHRPIELLPTTLTAEEVAEAERPVDLVCMLQQILDEEVFIETADGRRIGNVVEDWRQIECARTGSEWRLRCTVCDIPNLITDAKKPCEVREVAAMAKRHVGAWRSFQAHKATRIHWNKLSARMGVPVPMPVPEKGKRSAAASSGEPKKKRTKATVRTFAMCIKCRKSAAVVISVCGDPAHALCEEHAKVQYKEDSIADILENTEACFACPAKGGFPGWFLTCGVCGKKHDFNRNRSVLACSRCPRAYHATCLGLRHVSTDDHAPWRDGTGKWVCAACEIKREDSDLDACSALAMSDIARQCDADSILGPDAIARATLRALKNHDFGRLLASVPVDDDHQNHQQSDARTIMRDVKRLLDAPPASLAHKRMAAQLASLANRCFDTYVVPRIQPSSEHTPNEFS
ncbi:hypothetical protein CTAYLR_006094 [Chrysophaeum taylorii]|uniref:PHD-type domain-containing protein n=1 Tax=Chrysophaeum taylorii TaxID=2483200 RepID=A0AAD7UBT1_9STRA|nr:hypothetical protein CTAYLR_006094 [Chrysophaeum taylorii]